MAIVRTFAAWFSFEWLQSGRLKMVPHLFFPGIEFLGYEMIPVFKLHAFTYTLTTGSWFYIFHRRLLLQPVMVFIVWILVMLSFNRIKFLTV